MNISHSTHITVSSNIVGIDTVNIGNNMFMGSINTSYSTVTMGVYYLHHDPLSVPNV